MMVIYVPVKFEFDWTKYFELESGNENVDGQTDVGHINLIGGLVTRNPPKNGNELSLTLSLPCLSTTVDSNYCSPVPCLFKYLL